VFSNLVSTGIDILDPRVGLDHEMPQVNLNYVIALIGSHLKRYTVPGYVQPTIALEKVVPRLVIEHLIVKVFFNLGVQVVRLKSVPLYALVVFGCELIDLIRVDRTGLCPVGVLVL
jgi:hypothetical protein